MPLIFIAMPSFQYLSFCVSFIVQKAKYIAFSGGETVLTIFGNFIILERNLPNLERAGESNGEFKIHTILLQITWNSTFQ